MKKVEKNIAHFARKQKGFILQELAIAVIFLAVLGAAGYGAYRALNSDNSVDAERDNITSEVTRAFAAVEHQTDMVTPNTVNTALLISNNVFKSGVSGAVVKNKFGGTTQVVPASTAFGTNDALQWTKTGYTPEACTDVSRKIQNLAYSMKVNGQDVKTDTSPFDSDALGKACNTTNNNIVIFVTARR